MILLFCTTLAVVTPFFVQANYAHNEPTCVAKVKELYKDLHLETVFHEYEEESYSRLVKLIDTEVTTLPKGMFLEFASRIYKRKS